MRIYNREDARERLPEMAEALAELCNRGWRDAGGLGVLSGAAPNAAGDSMNKKHTETTESQMAVAFESIHSRLKKIKNTLGLIRQQGDIEVPARSAQGRRPTPRCLRRSVRI